MTELSELPLIDYYLANAHHGSFPEPSHNPAADSVTQSSGVCNLKLYSPFFGEYTILPIDCWNKTPPLLLGLVNEKAEETGYQWLLLITDDSFVLMKQTEQYPRKGQEKIRAIKALTKPIS